ncbi:MAG: histidine kinase [Bacteroides sp.]|nr:histidine kinase [Bacteroides sp.]
MKETITSSSYKRYLPEVMIYIVAWGCILLFPVVNACFGYLSGKIPEISWANIGAMYLDISPFVFLFLVSNYWLAPRLFMRKKIVAYVLSVILLSMLTFYVTSRLFPDPIVRKIMEDRELWEEKMSGGRTDGDVRFRPEVDKRMPREEYIPDRDDERGGEEADGSNFKKELRGDRPPFDGPPAFGIARGPFVGRVFIAILMFGFNIAVKLFFKSVRDEEALRELERHNLKSELNYLKYQINPHFFMNTLNNIHALVDIDSEKAKHTLVELSHLMRYVLYETNQRLVPFAREMDFLNLYVELMRIRYSHNVHIELTVPRQSTNSIYIPPLLFVSFVENAFKHGISYRNESFVSVKVDIEGQDILFRCTNSNHSRDDKKPLCDDPHHGVGLENIKKRLQLLYDDRYTLTIQDLPERYDVLLVIPIA